MRQIKTQQTEDRFIQKDKSKSLSLADLLDWYLDLNEVKELSAYNRCKNKIGALTLLIDVKLKVKDLSLEVVENYKIRRLQQNSPTKIGQKIAPKTVQEEIATLRRVLNLAVKYNKITMSPISHWPTIKVDNVRERILSRDEFSRLAEVTPAFMWRIILMAYHTGMRQAEILKLEWDQIDMEGWIRLRANQTKSGKARIVALNKTVLDMLQEMPRHPISQKVFLSANKEPLDRFTTYLRTVFERSLKQATIENFVFHDLRHTYVTNMMRAGHPEYAVMKQVGHESTAMLRRYQLIDESDLRCLQQV